MQAVKLHSQTAALGDWDLNVDTCLHIIQGNIARVLRGPNWGPKMAATTLTSREFNQDTSGAKKAARRGPVFITDRGRPAHVLMTIEDYQRLAGGNMSLAQALAQPGDSAFDFEPPRVGGGLFKPADLG